MPLHRLVSVKGARKRKKLVGRGPGSGHGKTSTRGHKGQRARAGRDFYLGFEGGQSPLIRRIPKRGFTHKKLHVYQLVNLKSLSVFSKISVIDPQSLQEKGIIKNSSGRVKILGAGQVTAGVTIKAHKFSKGAVERIEKAGGKIEIIK